MGSASSIRAEKLPNNGITSNKRIGSLSTQSSNRSRARKWSETEVAYNPIAPTWSRRVGQEHFSQTDENSTHAGIRWRWPSKVYSTCAQQCFRINETVTFRTTRNAMAIGWRITGLQVNDSNPLGRNLALGHQSVRNYEHLDFGRFCLLEV